MLLGSGGFDYEWKKTPKTGAQSNRPCFYMCRRIKAADGLIRKTIGFFHISLGRRLNTGTGSSVAWLLRFPTAGRVECKTKPRNVRAHSVRTRCVLNTARNDRKDASSYETNDAETPQYESRTTANNNDRSRVLVLPSGGYPVTRYPVNDDTVRKVRRVTRPKNMIALLFERADRKATGVLQRPGFVFAAPRDNRNTVDRSALLKAILLQCYWVSGLNSKDFPKTEFSFHFIFVFGSLNNDNSNSVRNENIFVDFG